MNYVLSVLILLSSSISMANRESGGNGCSDPEGGCAQATSVKLACVESAQDKMGRTLSADVVNGGRLENLVILSPRDNVKLSLDTLVLKARTIGAVKTHGNSVHATEMKTESLGGGTFRTDFTVIVDFDENWAFNPQPEAQLQLYCDECGGGWPKFVPNMNCKFE